MTKIDLPVLPQAMLCLCSALNAAGISEAALPCRLGKPSASEPQTHASRMDQIEEAPRVLGKSIEERIRDAA